MDLSKYTVLEQDELTIKLKHISTGGISYRYRSTCSKCGLDRGWKKKSKLDRICGGCAQRLAFIDSVDKSKFPDVNFTDYKENKASGIRTLYKMSCVVCSRTRGYQPLSKAGKKCLSCTKKQFHKSIDKDQKLATRKKISMTQTGEKTFVGFKGTEQSMDRNKFKSLGLAKQCFELYNYTCDRCGVKEVELNAHHLYSFNQYSNLRFNIYNLVALCKSCHDSFHCVYGRGKNTKEQYLEFKTNNTLKKEVYLVTGAPASGKSWVLSGVKSL